MPQNRLHSHPILEIPDREKIIFFWKNIPTIGKTGETIASALIANGITIFGYHPKDGAPLGIFCANGQCSQCLVLVDGKPQKACMAPIQPGISVKPVVGVPEIAELVNQPSLVLPDKKTEIIQVPVLIIGGGPAGLSAAIELGELGLKVLLVDDKRRLGGKLILQTHRFFGSTEAVYAGTRGIDIAQILYTKTNNLSSVETWLETTAVAIYEDQTVGLWRTDVEQYLLVQPEVLLVATGARERSLPFKGNTLPGIFGAGAFQTLVNRDLLKPAKNLFIVGGGNVGLIAGYHALQAGINVTGLVEAMPNCGGYKVHEDKLARFNVPIYTSHTILEAKGKDHVQSVVIAKIDDSFSVISGTEKCIGCDSVLIAVGLIPVNEFIDLAQEVGLPVFSAGDASEIAEASAAMYSGKIKGLEIAAFLGADVPEVPYEWREFEEVLKSHPGPILNLEQEQPSGDVFPVMHCRQEIPCDPCASVCPQDLIQMKSQDIRSLPIFINLDKNNCIACERCVAICPGLAITLVDFRHDPHLPIVSIPLEFSEDFIEVGASVKLTDIDGIVLGNFLVTGIHMRRQFSTTRLLQVQVPAEIAIKVAGVQLVAGWDGFKPPDQYIETTDHSSVVCRCEMVPAETIRELIKSGIYDINQIKAVTKATMGACGGKTCLELIIKLFREEGIPEDQVTDPTLRPVFVEIPLETLAKNQQEDS